MLNLSKHGVDVRVDLLVFRLLLFVRFRFFGRSAITFVFNVFPFIFLFRFGHGEVAFFDFVFLFLAELFEAKLFVFVVLFKFKFFAFTRSLFSIETKPFCFDGSGSFTGSDLSTRLSLFNLFVKTPSVLFRSLGGAVEPEFLT